MLSARYLGTANFGILAFATAFTSLFGVFGDLGLQTYVVREVARDKGSASKYLANVNLMKLILTTVTFLLIIVVINIMGYPPQTVQVVYILWVAVILQLFMGVYYSIFQAEERMELVAIGQIANSLITLAGIVLAIYLNVGIIIFALIYLISNALVLIYCIALTIRDSTAQYYSCGIFRYDKAFWKSTIRQSLPFGLQSLFIMIYYYTDTIILSKTGGDTAVGLYNAAYKLAVIPVFICAAFNTTLIPLMARFSVTSPELMEVTFRRYFKYMMLLAIPIGVGTTLLSSRFILLVYGESFAEAASVLQILIWSTVFMFLNGCYSPLIYALNKQILGMQMTFVAAIFNIVLNLIFIPQFGYIAASYVKSGTEFLVLILAYVLTMKLGYVLSLKNVSMDLVKIVFSSAVMGVAVWYFKDINLLILIPGAAVIYFVASFLVRFYDKHDIESVRQIMALFTKNKTADN
jgi:O-antigen/teichoic acid export membrane protein